MPLWLQPNLHHCSKGFTYFSLYFASLVNSFVSRCLTRYLSVSVHTLRTISISKNTVLFRNALSEVKSQIELLDFSGNCFPSIPAQNLRNCVKLMYLDLSDNKISEINNFELMNLPQLKELRLQNNQLSEIHPMAFMNVPQLQYLYMRDNLIGSLDGNRLQAFHRLEILDVTNNLLQKLPELKDLTSLKQVRLDGNLIEKIDTLAFSNNPNLQLISIENNNIVQVARNSFDSLDQLLVLLLSNNLIQSIERGMLDGVRNLQQLNLRNNSLSSVDENAFASLRQLTTLDLAYNNLTKIPKRTFSHQTKLFWLDLSNNQLAGFEEGTFDTKIANIILDGNPLLCDDEFDWFVRYLVTNRVRTFLPYQSEITCAGPEKYVGVRLKDLMMKKANDTLTEGMKTLGFNEQGQGPYHIHVFQAIPAMRNMPRVDVGAQPGGETVVNPNLNSAIEQVISASFYLSPGRQRHRASLLQFTASFPDMVRYPHLRTSLQLDPNLVGHVLRGGQIPGIPKETLDGIVQQYMLKMHEAAAAAQSGKMMKDGEKFLPPLEKLPKEIIARVIQGENLPGLNEEQTKVIKEYYTQRLPPPPSQPPSIINGTKPAFVFTNELLDMLKLLPPGYNLSKIPAEIVTAFSRGEVPDLRRLPQDLIEHFKNHHGILTPFKANTSLEEMLAKLPKFEKPVLSTFSPYDINRLSNEMIHEEEKAEREARLRYGLTYTCKCTARNCRFCGLHAEGQRNALAN
ncbi:unnamed protein product [Heligmosomoides polygyrus]|uniref:Leucine-rich repeat-containing protein 15 n=1 Tax=Heligmosomoides polygyrus TaxID=6339 RepID=A0A3P7ZTI4_HELPZ|nr:unnamed protein product [Heligmosomoides polygyrus]